MKKNINKQNKSEMGMNRNEFYEYKKNRVVDLAKKGAGISEMAQDLGVDEQDMYAFLSRNFGGIRKLKSMAKSGEVVPQLQMASMEVEKSNKGRKSSKKTTAKKVAPKKATTKRGPGRPSTKKNESETVLSAFNNAMSNEKEKLLVEFKNDVEKDIQGIVSEIKAGLEQVKGEMLSKFKSDVMVELSAMAQSL